jgi:hypothetical protein
MRLMRELTDDEMRHSRGLTKPLYILSHPEGECVCGAPNEATPELSHGSVISITIYKHRARAGRQPAPTPPQSSISLALDTYLGVLPCPCRISQEHITLEGFEGEISRSSIVPA